MKEKDKSKVTKSSTAPVGRETKEARRALSEVSISLKFLANITLRIPGPLVQVSRATKVVDSARADKKSTDQAENITCGVIGAVAGITVSVSAVTAIGAAVTTFAPAVSAGSVILGAGASIGSVAVIDAALATATAQSAMQGIEAVSNVCEAAVNDGCHAMFDLLKKPDLQPFNTFVKAKKAESKPPKATSKPPKKDPSKNPDKPASKKNMSDMYKALKQSTKKRSDAAFKAALPPELGALWDVKPAGLDTKCSSFMRDLSRGIKAINDRTVSQLARDVVASSSQGLGSSGESSITQRDACSNVVDRCMNSSLGGSCIGTGGLEGFAGRLASDICGDGSRGGTRW
jgi:hypothetical protein